MLTRWHDAARKSGNWPGALSLLSAGQGFASRWGLSTNQMISLKKMEYRLPDSRGGGSKDCLFWRYLGKWYNIINIYIYDSLKNWFKPPPSSAVTRCHIGKGIGFAVLQLFVSYYDGQIGTSVFQPNMTRARNGVGVPSKLQLWSFRSSITSLKPHLATQSLPSWNVGDLLCGDVAAAMDIVQECISIAISCQPASSPTVWCQKFLCKFKIHISHPKPHPICSIASSPRRDQNTWRQYDYMTVSKHMYAV